MQRTKLMGVEWVEREQRIDKDERNERRQRRRERIMVAHAPPRCARIIEQQAVALVGSRYTRKSISTRCTVSYGRWQTPRASQNPSIGGERRDAASSETYAPLSSLLYIASSTCLCQSRVTAQTDTATESTFKTLFRGSRLQSHPRRHFLTRYVFRESGSVVWKKRVMIAREIERRHCCWMLLDRQDEF